MANINYDSAKSDVSDLAASAQNLVKTMRILSQRFDARLHPDFVDFRTNTSSIDLVPEDLREGPRSRLAYIARRYDSHLARAEILWDNAQAALRRFRDVTAKKDRDVSVEAEHVRTQIKELQAFLAEPYPGQVLLDEVRRVTALLAARESLAQKTDEIVSQEVLAWDTAASALERRAREQFNDAAETASLDPELIQHLGNMAQEKVVLPLQTARQQAAPVVVDGWMHLAQDAHSVSLAFTPIANRAELREEEFKALREKVAAALEEVGRVQSRSETNVGAAAMLLQEASLLKGLPVLGLAPILEIFEIKPPPTMPSNTLNAGLVQTWYERSFAPVLKLRPALQIMHFFHPFFPNLGRLVVMGDDLREACRAACLCASTHVRAGRKVQVFVSSKGVHDIFMNILYDDGPYDVNLQQLSALNHAFSGRRTELKLLHAVYPVHVVKTVPSAAAGETQISIGFQPYDLPVENDQTEGTTVMTFLASVAPHGGVDEIVRTWTLPKGLSKLAQKERRSKVESLLSGRVFTLPDALVRSPSIHTLSLPGPPIQILPSMSWAQAISHLVRVKKTNPPMRDDADVRKISPNLLLLAKTVIESEKTSSQVEGKRVQGVYVGTDADVTDPEFVRLVVHVFREYAGFSDPEAQAAQQNDHRAVVGCSSLAEWNRTRALVEKDTISIYVFGRINDPAFAEAVRGQIAVLHRFMPIVYKTEAKRVERQFSPASMLAYDWGEEVNKALTRLLPGPYCLSEEMVTHAKNTAVNRFVVEFPR